MSYDRVRVAMLYIEKERTVWECGAFFINAIVRESFLSRSYTCPSYKTHVHHSNVRHAPKSVQSEMTISWQRIITTFSPEIVKKNINSSYKYPKVPAEVVVIHDGKNGIFPNPHLLNIP